MALTKFEDVAKLVDLGFAIHLPDGARAETRCGSPEYMAPEVHSGQPHGLTVDLWALGVLAFELRTASTPFFDERGILAIARKCKKGHIDWPEPENHAPGAGAGPIAAEERDFICRLIAVSPHKRLGGDFNDNTSGNGFAGLESHAFFKGMDWAQLYAQNVSAPWTPDLDDDEDVSNFEEQEDDDDEAEALTCADAAESDMEWPGF